MLGELIQRENRAAEDPGREAELAGWFGGRERGYRFWFCSLARWHWMHMEAYGTAFSRLMVMG